MTQGHTQRYATPGKKNAFKTHLLSTDLGPVLFSATEFGWPVKHSSNWMNASIFCTSEAFLGSDYVDENNFVLN